jgi:hypothetical protein
MLRRNFISLAAGATIGWPPGLWVHGLVGGFEYPLLKGSLDYASQG